MEGDNNMVEKNNVAATCVKQVPRLFKVVDWESGKSNLDIGGGKYDLGTEFLKEKGVSNTIYDPYNRPKEETDIVYHMIYGGMHGHTWDTVTLSNVLCVIENPEIQEQVLMMAYDALKTGGKVYITCYEGDKSGVGKTTSTGSFQQNKRLREYLPMIQKLFPDAKAKNGVITGTKLTNTERHILEWEKERKSGANS